MVEALGTLEELPESYRSNMSSAQVTPLWPSLRNVLPHGRPSARTRPTRWCFNEIRPLLLEAGRLTPVEKAERRVLVLSDSGRGDGALQVTATLYAGLQLLLPGERAPSHRHTPSAARVAIEGRGAFTSVDGERCEMERGDLILTPGGMWHEHAHEGTEPVIWLDILDLPLFVGVEGSYSEEGVFAESHEPDASAREFAAAGLLPARETPAMGRRHPMLRYPWSRTQAALHALAGETPRGSAVELRYVNPVNGTPCLSTIGFTARLLRGGIEIFDPVRSAAGLHHVVDGSGRSIVDGVEFTWRKGDTFSHPPFATISHNTNDDAWLIRADDAPMQQALGFFEERSQ